MSLFKRTKHQTFEMNMFLVKIQEIYWNSAQYSGVFFSENRINMHTMPRKSNFPMKEKEINPVLHILFIVILQEK